MNSAPNPDSPLPLAAPSDDGDRQPAVDVGGQCFESLANRSIVLTGPTASGKSRIGIELAKRINGEILSLDSIAVYRHLDIGSAKATAAEQSAVPHHLIDLVDPSEEFSVARYLHCAHAAVADVIRRGRVPIFVGGTPMFLKGVLRGFDPGPPADWEFRSAVEQDLAEHGIEALRSRLRQVDPLAEHRIGKNDARRMIRALEVAWQTGQPITHRQIQFDRPVATADCRVVAIRWPRPQLHDRINQRVDEMFAAGLVEEVRSLLDREHPLSRTARQAVGYREVLDYLDQQDASLDDTIALVATHTRQLAKRQESWFRSFSEIRGIDVDDPIDAEAIADRIVHQFQSDASDD
ncbi:IPP transferase [Rubripirellula lacrimiformis]|uniref:tRNA dimethylallyltransferase n=1 Tax=Rubripirellula lacrimiformis TaxID=1930273 RepID=A0A517NH99_9BACT|nr:tRNA (adenosine(37)-N6)-dimethylallyltransferase MiaA [Rubripirellula lacrimiformis]QDT06520.1 IPP transferase [Rubripirellula lacrimiformis]